MESNIIKYLKDSFFFTGDPKSQIRGVFKDGIFSGTVYYDGQIYGIEVFYF